MNLERPDKQISLNLIAICVFGMTISSLVTPLVNIDSTLPILTIFMVLVVATVDNFFWQSRLAMLVVDAIARTNPEYRQRIVKHEAGHFLVAYLLNIPVTGYTLSAWESVKIGQPALGGVIFAEPPEVVSSQLLQNYCTVWMAGIAAESLNYNRAEGGSEDRQKLRAVMLKVSKRQPEIVRQENLAIDRAKLLIQTNWQAYQALVDAMSDRQSVADCCLQIDAHLSDLAKIN